MKLSPAALAVSAAFVWGTAIFVIGGINSFVPGYGEPVLELVVSLYPGYDASGGFGDLLLGTSYAILDGLAAGFVFALLYNVVAGLTARVAGRPPAATADEAVETPAPTPTDEVAETPANPPDEEAPAEAEDDTEHPASV